MKRVLITGINSYIGQATKKWLDKSGSNYQVDTISVRDTRWKEVDFSKFDVVFHVAAIVHQKNNTVSKEKYFEINFDLTVDLANKAKFEGVKQFIFLSSMSVFGENTGQLNSESELKPTTYYGLSKLKAEQALKELESEKFKIAILRPPLVYGPGCKGNYVQLSKFATVFPAFPNVNNNRSMIFIDYLTELVRLLIENNDRGLFHPQNNELVNTSELVRQIATNHHHKIWISSVLLPLVWIGEFIPGRIGSMFKKVFGSSYYSLDMSYYKYDYRKISFRETVSKTEKFNSKITLN